MFSIVSRSFRSLPRVSSSRSLQIIQRDCYLWSCFVAPNISSLSSLPKDTIFAVSPAHTAFTCRSYNVESSFLHQFPFKSLHFEGIHAANSCVSHYFANRWLHARHIYSAPVELKVDSDIVRFSVGKPSDNNVSPRKAKKIKKKKMSKKAKLNELRFYRLKAKKKMNSPNPEVRIRYKLEKAKRKEEWLIEKLRKFEVPAAQAETHDPEMLSEEERHYLKRIGEKKKNYVPVGRRGVFGGVVLNMHLHWKKHETVKVTCKPCRPGQIHEYANELARLSKGIVIDIKPNNTIIFYRGKNYVQPKIMSPPNTLSKEKALEKYRYEQSLEHTSQFIEKLEKELEEYHKYLARHKKEKAGGVEIC